jgi:pre-mRNA-splicing helicase BRR2
VISSSGWLLPALAAMELSQITLQAMWEDDSPLMQLPHVTRARANALKAAGVQTVFALLELEEDARRKMLAELSKKEYAELAIAANRYPAVDVSYAVQTPDALHEGELVGVDVQLDRDTGDDDDDAGETEQQQPGKKAKDSAGAAKKGGAAATADDDAADKVELVCAPFYPTPRAESWWLLVGDAASKTLLTIKRVALGKSARASLQFVAPAAGEHKLTLYAVCDSYVGCDQVRAR